MVLSGDYHVFDVTRTGPASFVVFRSEHITVEGDVTIVLDIELEVGESAGDTQPVLTIFPQELEGITG